MAWGWKGGAWAAEGKWGQTSSSNMTGVGQRPPFLKTESATTAFLLKGCLLHAVPHAGPRHTPSNTLTHTQRQPSCAQTHPERRAGVTASDSCTRLCPPAEARATTSRSTPGTASTVDAISLIPFPYELFELRMPSTWRASLVMSLADVTGCKGSGAHFSFPTLLHLAKCPGMHSIPHRCWSAVGPIWLIGNLRDPDVAHTRAAG